MYPNEQRYMPNDRVNTYIYRFLLLPLGHRASVKHFVSLQFLNLKTVGRTPWTGDQPDSRPLPTQGNANRINADKHPCFEWDSNPRSQCSSGRRHFLPYTVRPLWSAVWYLHNIKIRSVGPVDGGFLKLYWWLLKRGSTPWVSLSERYEYESWWNEITISFFSFERMIYIWDLLFLRQWV
jgi:hypothetical protein